MIKINSDNKINGKDIYYYAEVKTRYDIWLKRCIENADLQNSEDFCTNLVKSTGGRPSTEYYFTIDAAKEICIISATKKAKELRRWLISESKKRENLEYITPKEAALAYEYINFFKYIENQKRAFILHKESFLKENPISKYVYAEFAKYRANVVGWDKEQVDNAISEYLKTHAGHNFTKLMKLSMSDKLSIIDVNEAIRVSILDLLFSKGTHPEIAHKFANMVKNVSKEMEVLALRKNENNLFQTKENIQLRIIK